MLDRNKIIDKLFELMEEAKPNLTKARGYNRLACRKARKQLVELGKVGKTFREVTVQEEKDDK